MESNIYERDYSAQSAPLHTTGSAVEQLKEMGFFQFYDALARQIPRMATSRGRESYERLLARCDALARRMGGKIRAVIDCDQWDASIQVTLPFFEFTSSEELEFLRDISERALSVCFSAPCRPGSVIMTVTVDYFTLDLSGGSAPDDWQELVRSAARQAGLDRPGAMDNIQQLLSLLSRQYPADAL